MNARFFNLVKGVRSASGQGALSFSRIALSPVMAACETKRFVVFTSRRSAGIRPPAESITRSPTTSLSAGISTRIPPRLTVTFAWMRRSRRSEALLALVS